ILTTWLSSLQNRLVLFPVIGILMIFCGFAAFGPSAKALVAGDTGPMTGNWIITFKNTAYPNDGSKAVKSTEEMFISIIDESPGSTSELTIQIIGQGKGESTLFGQRSGNGFIILNLFQSEMSFVSMGGSITPPKDGQTKSFKGTGSELLFPEATGTSDGDPVPADVTLFKFTAKRAPD
ncbi:MAG: hypothetical protein ACKVS6_17115, partial [Planctomycetota bacterium]